MAEVDLLVLGASGRVGRLLRAAWPEGDARVLWQYRDAATSGPQANDRPAIFWRPGTELPRARVVLVLSGITRGSHDELERNVPLAAGLAEAICRSGAEAALFASTMAVYGLTRPGGAREADPALNPRPYGAAKRRAEEAFLATCAGRCRATALRFGNVVGADLLGDIVAQGGSVTLDRFASGGPRRSYLGVTHLVWALRALTSRLMAGERLPPALNVAAAQAIDMADLLSAAGLPFDWRPAPETALEEAAMDCSLLASLVPPRPDVETAAALAADWLRVMRP